MKKGIHPKYEECKVTCGCGETFVTRATQPEIRVEICSKCHPFYTGKQKLVDTAGRVEKFQRRYANAKYTQQDTGAAAGSSPDRSSAEQTGAPQAEDNVSEPSQQAE